MNPLRRSLVAAAVAVLLAVPAAARADSYVALKGGVWVPTAQDGVSAIQGISEGKFPPSGDIELAYGATMGILGVQLAGGYMWSNAPATDTTPAVKVSGIPFYGLLQLRLPIFFIQPYIEAGVGGFVNNASNDFTNTSQTKLSFMAIGGAGVDFILGPVLLGAEARYLYISPADFTWDTAGTATLRMSGVNVTANVGYVF